MGEIGANSPATFTVHKRDGLISVVFWTEYDKDFEFRFSAEDADRLVIAILDALEDAPLLPDDPHA